MKDYTTKERSMIPQEYKWDLSSLYADYSLWEHDYNNVKSITQELLKFRSSLADNSANLLECLKLHDKLSLTLERVFVYARMKRDENNLESKYQAFLDKAQILISEISAAISFFTPALSEIPKDLLEQFYIEKPELKIYKHFFEVLERHKSHILSPRDEEILAEFSQITSCPEDVFTILNNGDMDFGTVLNGKGENLPLTHGTYIGYLESKDDTLRENAFKKLYSEYDHLKNTLAQTYSYSVKTDIVTSRLRKYSSPLEAALFGDNIPENVYSNLISTINSNLDALHDYMALKKRILGNETMHMYDIYVPFENNAEKNIAFEEAVDIMQTALSPLGDEYISTVSSGVKANWIDVYENKGKTSGAYSFGAYDSNPYILMNYSGKLKDVFTLVHEMGHSMHSYYTRRNQPFIYGGHSIFTAEVASTVNENLLMHHLLKNSKDDNEKKYLNGMHLEEFRGTVFRQTMFAEFEAITHEECQKGEILTCENLCDIYSNLNKKYMGPHVYQDKEISLEWARIPHFYNSFYVYKYATGYLAAAFIAQSILSGDKKNLEGYIEFLKSGDRDYPIELLKLAGVDMSRPEAIDAGMKEFRKILADLNNMYL